MGLAFKRFATSLVRWLLLIGSVCAHQHMYFDAPGKDAGSIAHWLFDEQLGLYSSCVLGDAASNNIPLVLGPGGHLVEGRFGNALQPTEPPGVNNPLEEHLVGLAARQQLAVNRPDAAPAIMTWQNNGFCALMTRGEKHLRQEVEFASPTQTTINHAHSDWTIEFWFKLNDKPGEQDGVIFEIGEGPRSADTDVTLLLLAQDQASFTLVNKPRGTQLRILTIRGEAGAWRHLAFVFDATEGQLRHHFDGKLQPLPDKCQLTAFDPGEEDYLSSWFLQ